MRNISGDTTWRSVKIAEISKAAILASAAILIMTLALPSCSSISSNSALTTGMTPQQTIDAMGQPDLRDQIPDPARSGATVLRYVWLDSGKVAVFGANDRVASVQQITPASAAVQRHEAAEAQTPPPPFDPINTPLNYAFYPIKVGLMYIGAGINCIGGGDCRKPVLPSPSQG